MTKWDEETRKHWRNRLYRTFLRARNGKGRSMMPDGLECSYEGCAVGCQNEFQEACIHVGVVRSCLKGICRPDGSGVIAALCKEAWRGLEEQDLQFLRHMQQTHDMTINWEDDRLTLKPEVLAGFELRWGVSQG